MSTGKWIFAGIIFFCVWWTVVIGIFVYALSKELPDTSIKIDKKNLEKYIL